MSTSSSGRSTKQRYPIQSTQILACLRSCTAHVATDMHAQDGIFGRVEAHEAAQVSKNKLMVAELQSEHEEQLQALTDNGTAAEQLALQHLVDAHQDCAALKEQLAAEQASAAAARQAEEDARSTVADTLAHNAEARLEQSKLLLDALEQVSELVAEPQATRSSVAEVDKPTTGLKISQDAATAVVQQVHDGAEKICSNAHTTPINAKTHTAAQPDLSPPPPEGAPSVNRVARSAPREQL